jgi:hypothetical protein
MVSRRSTGPEEGKGHPRIFRWVAIGAVLRVDARTRGDSVKKLKKPFLFRLYNGSLLWKGPGEGRRSHQASLGRAQLRGELIEQVNAESLGRQAGALSKSQPSGAREDSFVEEKPGSTAARRIHLSRFTRLHVRVCSFEPARQARLAACKRNLLARSTNHDVASVLSKQPSMKSAKGPSLNSVMPGGDQAVSSSSLVFFALGRATKKKAFCSSQLRLGTQTACSLTHLELNFFLRKLCHHGLAPFLVTCPTASLFAAQSSLTIMPATSERCRYFSPSTVDNHGA